MRILGIDYGTKRIGLALSDEAGQFALPHSVIKNSKTALEETVTIAETYQVTDIVMGESRDYKGEPNAIFAEANSFKEKLHSRGFTVHLEPEFMTSHQADRLHHELGGDGSDKDASAAAIILQSYLDRK
jgi:putative Holliday junction resolvase